MSHVVYHNKSFQRLDNRSFATERAAKAALTRAVNREGAVRTDYTVATYQQWCDAEPMVETYNMLDPQRRPILIRASEKGGCTDPATERYHSM